MKKELSSLNKRGNGFLSFSDFMVAEPFAELSSVSVPCYLGHTSFCYYGE